MLIQQLSTHELYLLWMHDEARYTESVGHALCMGSPELLLTLLTVEQLSTTSCREQSASKLLWTITEQHHHIFKDLIFCAGCEQHSRSDGHHMCLAGPFVEELAAVVCIPVAVFESAATASPKRCRKWKCSKGRQARVLNTRQYKCDTATAISSDAEEEGGADVSGQAASLHVAADLARHATSEQQQSC